MQVSIERSIIKVLAYFDLFNYPVTKEEVVFFLDSPMPEAPVQQALDALVDAGIIFRLNTFYSLQNEWALAERRIKGNGNAESLLITAHKVSRFLFRFPYVRGIGISGSLSKKFADEKADIDFFIITKANRLWIARTAMHLFKKLTFLVGKQHWFCMNYYIDEKALQIEEHNIFTAMELTTLIPVYGNGTMDSFFHSNQWATYYFPNYIHRNTGQKKRPTKHSFFKRVLEGLFNNRLGERLDNYLMKLTAKRWKQKEDEQRLNSRGVCMSLRCEKHFSKPNPVHFQKQVLERYHQKLAAIDKKMKSSLVNTRA